MTPTESNIPVGLCQCGCGQNTAIAPQNHTKRRIRKGIPQRYVPGHSHPKRTFDNIPDMKTCLVCGETKSRSEFGFAGHGIPVLYSYCRPCATQKQGLLPLDSQLWNGAKARAKKKGLPFCISKADIIIPEVCPILGMPMARNFGCLESNSYTLDQIIPGLGYTPGNIQVISYKANVMKSNASPEELRSFAVWVQRTYTP